MRFGTKQYRFGVNYTPTRAWYYCWNDFDADGIARDLDVIVELGADHIRAMLIWPYFQPNPWVVSQVHLERLNTLMELAAERCLDVNVGLFVGWLSGYAFKPPYQNDGTFYSFEEGKSSQELYVKSVSEIVKNHENFLGFDLGNELNCCWRTESADEGDRWHNHMMALASECVPNGIHVNGVDNSPWFDKATFSPECLARTQKIVPLHCWPFFTGALTRAGGDCFDPRVLWLLEAMGALARSYAGDAEKPIWVQEYGMSETWTEPGNIPRFLEESTLNALGAGVNWFTWWSSHDLDPDYRFDPLEYSLGLIAHDQKIKPQGEVFRELAKVYGGKEVTGSQEAGLPTPPQALDKESTWEWLETWIEKRKTM